MEDGMEIPQKLGIKPPYDPAIPLLGIFPEETNIEKDTRIPLFTAALFTIARTWWLRGVERAAMRRYPTSKGKEEAPARR